MVADTHAHPRVLEAVTRVAAAGTSFGAPSPPEIELAERVCSMYPGLEAVRFVSSGTEAVMAALRVARAELATWHELYRATTAGMELDPDADRPVGVVSTLDVAEALAQA